MKSLLFILFLSQLVHAENAELEITTKVTEYPARNAKTGRTIRTQTFRGCSKIREYIEKDTEGDGIINFTFDAFYVDGSVVYSMTRIKTERSTSFDSHGDITVQIMETKTPGQLQQIAFFTSKGVLREMFIRNAKGELEPLSKEEFKKGLQETKNLSPFLDVVSDAIEDVKSTNSSNTLPLSTDKISADSSTIAPP